MTENTIVVAGGGFAGLRAAMDIAKLLRKHRLGKRYSVLLIDQNGKHTFTPLLYKYAARPEFPLDTVCLDIQELIRGLNIELVLDDVQSLDAGKGSLKLASGKEIKAAYILLASGSETNWFNIPGLAEHALPLKTFESADKLRQKIAGLPADASVIVGGGGPTGIELAAEIRVARGLKVSIVEAMPTLMPGFAPRFAALAAKRLQSLGVEILTNEPIAEADADKIISKSGKEMPFDLLIWTGGVKVPDWLKGTPLKAEARGRIEAGLDMECMAQSPDLSLAAHIYAAGDVACVHMPDGTPMPPVARAAIEEGKVAARNIISDILSEEGLKEVKHTAYHPAHYPYVMPVGGNYALANAGSLIWNGFTASLFKEVIVLNYLLSILPLGSALKVWRDGF